MGILKLKHIERIRIYALDTFWSSGCDGNATITINCQVGKDYLEDPRFEEMRLDLVKSKGNTATFKVKIIPVKED